MIIACRFSFQAKRKPANQVLMIGLRWRAREHGKQLTQRNPKPRIVRSLRRMKLKDQGSSQTVLRIVADAMRDDQIFERI